MSCIIHFQLNSDLCLEKDSNLLTQQLKLEANNDNALKWFLTDKGLRQPKLIMFSSLNSIIESFLKEKLNEVLTLQIAYKELNCGNSRLHRAQVQ